MWMLVSLEMNLSWLAAQVMAMLDDCQTILASTACSTRMCRFQLKRSYLHCICWRTLSRTLAVNILDTSLLTCLRKSGAILASIPQALAAPVLCFMWALTVGLGLSNLKHCQASSFRNMEIVGVSLFLGLSIPAYFQQYHPESSLILPGYLIPYSAASSGPINTGSQELDFAINGLLSLSMVVTFIISLVLDNTVPGSKEDRGAYGWSSKEDLEENPESLANYSLPKKIAGVCCWAKCLGV